MFESTTSGPTEVDHTEFIFKEHPIQEGEEEEEQEELKEESKG